MSIGSLTRLTLLDLSENLLSSTIPKVIATGLERLNILRLGFNDFSGEFFPPPLQMARNLLNEVNVSNNPRLIGQPLSYVRVIGLHDGLMAMIPYLTNITTLDLSNCSFTGQLFEAPYVKSIQYFNIADNKFSGYMPYTWSPDFRFENLQVFDGCRNDLDGEIPWRYFNRYAPNLHTLQLSGNRFIGELPEEPRTVDNLLATTMKVLDVSHNQLRSRMPAATIGLFTELEKLFLHGNDLVGTIPSSIGSCNKLQHLSLSDNKFSGTLPVELLQSSSLRK